VVTATRNPSPPTPRGGLTLAALRLPAERQPGGRPPAPGDLAVVQAFVNTFWDLDRGGADRFEDPRMLAEWLSSRGLIGPRARLDDADLRRTLEVREGLREMLFANNGAGPDRPKIDRLNRALPAAELTVHLNPDTAPGLTVTGSDLDGALAAIATVAAVAQLDGRWKRLKACPGAHCGWSFYDHSRNHAGTWCAMSVCGSRAKARQYRRRRRSAARRAT